MAGLFPDPRHAPGDAPLAVGEDFSPATLLEAYAQGIFPWPDGHGAVYWWSPDPRAVILVGTVRRPRSLRQRIRHGAFLVTIDTAFEQVVRACSDRPGDGTWITPAMRTAYMRLHAMGHAHSVEVWQDGALVGGLYGIAIGGVFTGESMFHRVSDASKIALVALDDHLVERGFGLIDAQLHTDHLEWMGAVSMPRRQFLDTLSRLGRAPVTFTG
ncbi:leucyl/phenylalanyl-tRNA--protein transferase [soil metagenome]